MIEQLLNDVVIYTTIVLSVFVIVIYKINTYFDKKNKKLIQLYLELKFVHKNLSNLMGNFNSFETSINLIESIKEYYNLEDIVIFDSVNMEFKTSRPRVLKRELNVFLQKNLKRVSEKFKTQECIIDKTEIDGKKYIIYIFNLFDNSSSFIVCVEDFPALIASHELLGLSINISLLKIKLLHE
jgi:hypothetical protein